jgi:predicted DNA-binding transcriptional regulator YafY
MAKQDYILRYLTIIKILRRNKETTLKEIKENLKKEAEFQDRPFSISPRTFQRDLNEIRSLFNVDIQYNFSSKVYYIADDLNNDLNNRMLESIDMINSLKVVSDITKYMFFEKRKARGTHHFYGLIHAIKNRIVINLTHQKYDSDEPKKRLVEPYALKEAKGRWYLFAKDCGDKILKTFGLDRILDFENTSKRFDYPKNLDVNKFFRDCFGVINSEDGKQQEIILSFDPEQGKYIKSYPLHDTQIIITDDEDELRVKLNLCITHDLIMELLSYGDTMEVIAPKSLREEITTIFGKALKYYEEQ